MKLFASCDSVYLRAHAPALVASAACHNNSIHINVCNPDNGDRDILDNMSLRYQKIMRLARYLHEPEWPQKEFTWSMSTPFDQPKSAEEWRTLYACDRFISASTILEQHKVDLLIIDTDCLIMKHIDPILNDQIGLFLREPLSGTQGWENEGSRVAAGAVFISQEAKPFLDKVEARIKQGPLAWFLDQVAINEVYQKHVDDYRFMHFDSKFMDWNFVEGSTIWTGKGPRKFENKKYLAMKDHYDRMML